MASRRLTRIAAVAALGILLASEAAAIGLARARGAVIIGRPLNVAIAATREAGDPDTPCVDADVFHGDTRVNPRHVAVRWEPGQGDEGTIRVTSAASVDEPAVTIYLRVGCTNRITRRYVMLADEPSDTAAPPAAPSRAEGVPLVPPVATPRQSTAQRGQAPARVPAQASATPVAPQAPVAAQPLAVQPAQRIAPATRSAQRERERERERDRGAQGARLQPRLKLEPLDLTPPTEAALRTTGRLEGAPTDDPERRRQAAALWRALTAGPEEAMRNNERLAVLERDMKGLFELTRRNALALEAMREQTEKARGERNILAQLAILLVVLLVLAAAAGAFWLRRTGLQSPAWWRRRNDLREGELNSDFGADAAVPAVPAAAASAGAAAPAEVAAVAAVTTPKKGRRDSHARAPDIDLSVPGEQDDDIEDSTPPQVRAPAPPAAKYKPKFSTSRWGNSEFGGSYPGGAANSRMLKAEELIDIQQQADFFLSIDQPDRAVALLESHLEQDDTSALAWVDLLDIYRRLDRREDYDRIREGFHERFNARVPPFDDFTHEQDGLEKYGRALSRIVSLWPSRRVLDVIEESLLRQPDDTDSEAFDLEAYRELVLLYNIGRELQQMESEGPQSQPRSSGFGDTSMLSLSALQAATAPRDMDFGAPTQPADVLVEPMDLMPQLEPVEQVELTSDSLGLDIDLGDFDVSKSPSEAQASAPAPTPSPTPAPLMDLDSLDWRSIR